MCKMTITLTEDQFRTIYKAAESTLGRLQHGLEELDKEMLEGRQGCGDVAAALRESIRSCRKALQEFSGQYDAQAIEENHH